MNRIKLIKCTNIALAGNKNINTMVNSNTCTNFRTDLSKALEALEKKYGMDIKVGTLRYTSNSISTKIDAAVESQDQL
jgi:hypothetical protein